MDISIITKVTLKITLKNGNLTHLTVKKINFQNNSKVSILNGKRFSEPKYPIPRLLIA